MRKKFALILIMILSVMCFSAGLAVSVSAQDQVVIKTVRIAFPLQKGLSQKDEKGRYSGYTYDYLMRLSQFTNWKLEFTEPESSGDSGLNEMISAVKNGELDIMCALKKHSTVTEILDFPEKSYGLAYTILGILDSNGDLNESNYKDQETLKVAVLSSSIERRKELLKFCEENLINLQIIECENKTKIAEKLNSGDADAYLGLDVDLMENTKILTNFAPQPFYFATTKGNAKLIEELDDGIAKLNKSDPYFTKNLYTKYFLSDNYILNFTQEEKDFAASAPPVKALIASLAPPFQYGSTRDPRGASISFLKDVTQKTGLKFNYTVANASENLATAIEKYVPDIVVGIPVDDELALNHQLMLSKDYFDSDFSLFAQRSLNINDLSVKKAALPRGANIVIDTDPSNIKYYDNINQCIQAVSSGKADYGYANKYSVNYFLTKDVHTKIVTMPLVGIKKMYSFGILRDATDALILLTIVNKVIRAIPPETMISYIVTDLSEIPGRYSFLNYLKANSLEAILIAVAIVVFLSLCVFVAVFIKIRANKKIVALTNNICGGMLEFKITDDFDFTYVSDGFFYMLGLKREEINADNWKSFFDVCELYEAVNDVKAAMESGVRFHCELSFKAGEEIKYLNVEGSRIGKSTPPVVQAICTDITKTKSYLNQVEALARTDMLTGIYNKDTIEKTVGEKMNSVEKPVLMIFDIDNFKSVNDTLGHEKGDEVIKETAKILVAKLHPNAFVGRLGGDEFIALVHSLDKEIIENKIRNIRFELDHRSRMMRLPFPISLSIGLLDISVNKVETFIDAYKKTDKAMYEAKNKGKNLYIWYQE